MKEITNMNRDKKSVLVKLIREKLDQKLTEALGMGKDAPVFNPPLKGGAKRFASKLDPKLDNALKAVLPQLNLQNKQGYEIALKTTTNSYLL